MTRSNERDESATGRAEALHDAYAQPLYRYAWSLLGGDAPGAPEDPVAEAVHEGLVAGVMLEAELTDPADRGPWLYALVRAACQRRGFAHTCPYTRLATVADEAPVARMFSRLPASHRELVELNLRHALPATAIARVLGLETRMSGELSRSAIRRAADGLSRLSEHDHTTDQDDAHDQDGPDEDEPDGDGDGPETGGPTWREQVHRVSTALALLRPPGAPPGLREHVVHTCASPESAGERARIAASMRPLTTAGYPVHRTRAAGGTVLVLAPEETAPSTLPTTPRPLPEDRLTTHDHPVREKARAPLPAPDHDPETEAPLERRRWSLPAVSGLTTAAAALALWWWASMMGAPSTMIDAGPAETGRTSESSQMGALSTDPENKPADGSDQTGGDRPQAADAPTPGTVQDQTSREETEQTDPGPEPEPERPAGTEPDPGSEHDHPEAPEEEADPPRTPEDDHAPEEEPGGEEPEGEDSGGLLSGLLGLLFGGS